MVSIIIPFYNEELYLERAISSAVCQTYSDIEIILVNDGSTDNSLKIAEGFKKTYKNIQLISSENFGLGNARNIGLEIAKGDHVLFLDSDDAIDENCVSKLAATALDEKADIVVCKFSLYNKEQEKFKEVGWKQPISKIKGLQAAKEMYLGGVASVAWAKLYNSRVIKDIKFPTKVWFEDRPYVLEAFLRADSVYLLEDSLFNIYAREESITRRVVTKKRIEDLYSVYLLEIETIKKYEKDLILSQIIIDHHIDVLLDSFFLIHLDRNKIDIDKISRVFIDSFEKFETHQKKFRYKKSLKKQLTLLIFRFLYLLPFSWVALLGKNIFRNKYKSVKLLKCS